MVLDVVVYEIVEVVIIVVDGIVVIVVGVCSYVGFCGGLGVS